MRLRMTYQINKVPIDYRASFVGLAKEAVRVGDEEIFKTAYENAARFTKPFCFSVFFQDFKKSGDTIEIGGLTSFNVSMLDFFKGTEVERRICLALFNGLRSSKLEKSPFPLGEELKRIHVQLVNERTLADFTGGRVQFKTMSPVFLTSGEKNGARAVLHPKTAEPHRKGTQRENVIYDEETFNGSLAMSLKGCVNGSVGFEPVNLKAEVIQHTIGEHVRSMGRPLKFICSSGTFILSGSPEDLFRVYQTGIGFKRNQGFGMLEVE